MKNFTKLIWALSLVFISCEIEKIDVQENNDSVYGKAAVSNELNCQVIDADRCPFNVGSNNPLGEQPAANFWWPDLQSTDGVDISAFFNAQDYFGSIDGNSLSFIEYDDGTAHLQGTTKSNGFECVVEVDVYFKGKTSWIDWEAAGGGHKKEGCAGDASNSEDMVFYIIDSEKSTITATGTDCYGTGTFGLEQRPDPNDNGTPNFGAHVGPAGANYDSDPDAIGLSTWGWITDKDTGDRLWIMDFNFIIECPEVPCEPCDGKVTELSLKYNGSETDANIVVKQKKDNVIVFDEIVQPGDIFSFVGTEKNGTLGTEIKIYVNGEEQTKIHTSCSQPIGPGLISGDFEVVGGASLNGGELCPVDTPPGGGDCGECDGKVTKLTMQNNGSDALIRVAQKKDDVTVFEDNVTSGASFSFSGTDKNGTLGTEIIIYVDGVEHTRIHTSCSQPIGPGLVSGDFEVLGGASLKGGELCPIDIPPTPPGGDCGECDGKAINLTMQNNGSDATIVVKQKKDDVTVFDGFVASGDSFSFSGKDKNGTLGTEIIIYVNGVENTRIHTSCSQPLGPGLISGDFEVLGGASRNGGEFCPIDVPPTPPGGDCGECDGKAINLTMQNNGSDALIRVAQKKDDVTVFEDNVTSGASFSFSGTDKNGTLGTEIIIYVNGVENTRIHTSCSQPLGPGLISGDFEVLGGASRNGGEFCPI